MEQVNTDILKIGNQMYAIRAIESQEIDIERELRELYEERHRRHVETLNSGVVVEAQADWNRQIEHIRSFNGRGEVKIPRSMYNKPIIVRDGVIYDVRTIIFAPCEMFGNYDYFCNQTNARTFLEPWIGDRDKELIVSIKPSFKVPLIIGYNARNGNMITPIQKTFHTMHDTTVCTGNHTAAQFWALSDEALEHEFNRINLFSPATRHIQVRGHTKELNRMLTAQTYLSIRERGAEAWTT